MKVDIQESIYELIETGKESITVRCKIDGNEEVWVPTEGTEDSVYELVVDEKTYRYDHAKAAQAVASVLQTIKKARTRTNAPTVSAAVKSLRSFLATIEPLVKARAFTLTAAAVDQACQKVYVACDGDVSAETGLAILHKANKVVACLAGKCAFPEDLLEKSSEAFQATWKEAQKVVAGGLPYDVEANIIPDINPAGSADLQHNDIVEFKPNSPYKRPGYYRVDIENAIGATPQNPWIGEVGSGAGWYIDAEELVVVLSSNEFDTEHLHSKEDVEELLEDFDEDFDATAGKMSDLSIFVEDNADKTMSREDIVKAVGQEGFDYLQKNHNLMLRLKDRFLVRNLASKTAAPKAYDPIKDLQSIWNRVKGVTEADEETACYHRLVTYLQEAGKAHEATPEADGKFEVNCVGPKNELLWSKKAKTKKEALALVSEAKKTGAIHIELIDSENRTWYYDRNSTADKWSEAVEM